MFIVGKSEHTKDNFRCEECMRGFPAKCACGGFIHAEFEKETWDNHKVIDYKCDKCADKFKFLSQQMGGKRRNFGQIRDKKRKFKRRDK